MSESERDHEAGCVAGLPTSRKAKAASPTAVFIHEVPIRRFYLENASMMAAHWAEVAGIQTGAAFAPNLAPFEALETHGALINLVALLGGVVIGYSTTILFPDHHAVGSLVAQNDAIYVDPLCREGGLGRMLVESTERLATQRGADRIVWGLPVMSPMGRMLIHRGYLLQQVCYSKALR